jgi:CRP-like cAMP-binding protein
MPDSQISYTNRFLRRLSANDVALLAPHLSYVDLHLGRHLEVAGQAVDFVYFPESGIASTTYDEGGESHRIEIGLVGREGLTGTSVILADGRSPNGTVMQVGGEGYRIGSEEFLYATSKSVTLQRKALNFMHVMFIQASQTALSNRRASLEERLARWLLMSSDRLDSLVLNLTNKFLSIMLGVRRAGVTEALQSLEGVGIIKAQRVHIRIIDRPALVRLASDYYGVPEREYERLFGKV